MRILPKRLLELNHDELDNRYQKQRAMRYIMIIGGILISGFVIRAILVFYTAINTISSADVQFFMGLTIFIIMVNAGLLLGMDLHYDSMMRQVYKNQVDIMQQLRINEHDNKLLDKTVMYLTDKEE
jgi:hypothetical protein